MPDAPLPPEGNGVPPLNVPEELILQRLATNANSGTARLLSYALRLSIMPIDSDDIEASVGPRDIVARYRTGLIIERYKKGLDLKTLNDYKVILSKKEGCRMLIDLGVRDISDNYLNRHLNEKTYDSTFGRDPSSITGRGRNKLLFTYSEIVHFYTEYLNRSVPDPLPNLPESLINYANEVDDYL
ncbi:MAG: hypothetical protein AAF892_12540 [Cyanobacteria bacterium P01_D01_bin.71]